MDFTLKTYKKLLLTILENNYIVLTFQKYCLDKNRFDNDETYFVILRHDVDEIAENALKMARLEHQLGVQATYYFRIVKQSNKPEVIEEIASLGHEIGYHYEDLAFAKGNMEEARVAFENNLSYFRTFYPVKTVCMHGSGTSKYDNRKFWKDYKLSQFGLIGEPYLTTNFDKISYCTDTARRWDGIKYNIWDRVESSGKLIIHSSAEMMNKIENGTFYPKSLILAHTLWTDNFFQWGVLYVREFLRNKVKYIAQHNQFVNKLYARLVRAYWKR